MKQMPRYLTAAPFKNWGTPPGCPCTMWMKTIQKDMKSNNLSLNEAIVESSTLETDIYVWRYAVLVVLARKEDYFFKNYHRE